MLAIEQREAKQIKKKSKENYQKFTYKISKISKQVKISGPFLQKINK